MIEFDLGKRAGNIQKHGIDFTDVEPVFIDPRAFTNDRIVDTKQGPEHRHITTGMDCPWSNHNGDLDHARQQSTDHFCARFPKE